ncbi:MAG: pantothenate synthetase [Phycisphaerae bacterium]|nr:MAG: pantothenate synthetase [Phycisphaerae bacterium]
MIKAHTIQGVRESLNAARQNGQSIGFVPTMGALHAGHWLLIERARAECDVVVVSIFVNPLQFGPTEDLDRYPATLDDDLSGCEERGVDLAFCPSVSEMYGDSVKFKTRVHVDGLSDCLCGRSRSNHFDGVCTVVAKLFGIVGPDRAYFGEKDFQQLMIVRQMVTDLSMPVKVVACETCREDDGLAISSRNQFLSADQRESATSIYASLCDAVEMVNAGQSDVADVMARIRHQIETSGADRIDYVEIVDAMNLELLTRIDRPARICVAAFYGETRLIDNVAVDAPAPAR